MFGTRRVALAGMALWLLGATACGSSNTATTASRNQVAPAPGGSGNSGGGGASAGALSADATSAATGDIPDNQVFLVFHDRQLGFSIKYPEGWTQARSASDVTFRDKNNLVRIRVSRGPAPTPASVTQDLTALKRSDPSLAIHSANTVSIAGRPAVKSVYSTESAPNAVTGRRVLLFVDRYELSQGGRLAIVDLGTPKGVDNIDAYKMMINSFRWQ